MGTILSKICQECGNEFRFRPTSVHTALSAECCPHCNKKRRGRAGAKRYAAAHPERIKTRNAKRYKGIGRHPGDRTKNSFVWIEDVRHKVCSHCKVPKPTDGDHRAFGRSMKPGDGFQAWCNPCKAEALRASRAGNPDKTRTPRRASYVRNHTTNIARSRKVYALQALDPVFRQEAVHKTARWRTNNPAHKKLLDMRRDARKAGLPDTMTKEDVACLSQYWNFAGAICGADEGLFGVQRVLDHWMALADPACPGTVPTNMVLLCNGPGSCNTSKLHTPVLDWLTRRYGERKARQVLRKVEAYVAGGAGTSTDRVSHSMRDHCALRKEI